jgi:hypothetical protein
MRFEMNIDLSLANLELYAGCDIENIAGRFNLKTQVADTVQIVGSNIAIIVSGIDRKDRNEVTLTGPMAVWSYLVAFHTVVHSFSSVWYDDGRNAPVLIASTDKGISLFSLLHHNSRCHAKNRIITEKL